MTIGIIFPPTEDGIMKITGQECFKNEKSESPVPGLSLPRYRSLNSQDGIPDRFDGKIRSFLRDTLPELADHKWNSTRICWYVYNPTLQYSTAQVLTLPSVGMQIQPIFTSLLHSIQSIQISSSHVVAQRMASNFFLLLEPRLPI